MLIGKRMRKAKERKVKRKGKRGKMVGKEKKEGKKRRNVHTYAMKRTYYFCKIIEKL